MKRRGFSKEGMHAVRRAVEILMDDKQGYGQTVYKRYR